MIPTYSEVLNAIEKTLWELVEEYWEVRRSLQDLVKGQKRNIAQLERTGAVLEWRWSLEGENEKEKSGDGEKRSKDGPKENQKKGILLSIFY